MFVSLKGIINIWSSTTTITVGERCTHDDEGFSSLQLCCICGAWKVGERPIQCCKYSCHRLATDVYQEAWWSYANEGWNSLTDMSNQIWCIHVGSWWPLTRQPWMLWYVYLLQDLGGWVSKCQNSSGTSNPPPSPALPCHGTCIWDMYIQLSHSSVGEQIFEMRCLCIN